MTQFCSQKMFLSLDFRGLEALHPHGSEALVRGKGKEKGSSYKGLIAGEHSLADEELLHPVMPSL